MIRRTLLVALGAAAALPQGFRRARMPPDIWHVDPFDGTRTGRSNDYLVADGGDRPPAVSPIAPLDLMRRLDKAAMAEPGTERIAGTPDDLWVTYVQRSRLMGFPDAISVRAMADGTGSRMAIFSRSRFGQSDLGVNAARVERWLAALPVG
ncbi:DUF1499 domain-containing protein [Jannaschia sp. S6380]|uniref:DUF1499 domain-containing protein n=1 Tax=Jannaschia sp. S6380 TaxID=2926408 RepID=UPI001FF3C9B5|nr:DUF1499 domain-containing protein [Jannaschia sp. S6380]MCK0167175.1 DUF1499 domain-containing protein [Jannaschia sp. S6380]